MKFTHEGATVLIPERLRDDPGTTPIAKLVWGVVYARCPQFVDTPELVTGARVAAWLREAGYTGLLPDELTAPLN